MSTQTAVPEAQPAHAPAAPKPSSAPAHRCPRCGSTDLGSGTLLTDRPKFRPPLFAPKGLSLARARRLFRLPKSTLEVACAVCRSCGHLMLQVDPEQLKELEARYPA